MFGFRPRSGGCVSKLCFLPLRIGVWFLVVVYGDLDVVLGCEGEEYFDWFCGLNSEWCGYKV